MKDSSTTPPQIQQFAASQRLFSSNEDAAPSSSSSMQPLPPQRIQINQIKLNAIPKPSTHAAKMAQPSAIDEEFMLHTNYSSDQFKAIDNKKDTTKLIAVFEHKNRRFVRVYESTSREFYYRCLECYSKNREVQAKISPDEQVFKVFEPFSHICSPMRYSDAVLEASAPAAEEEPMDTEEPMPGSSLSGEEEETENKKPRKYQNQKKFDEKWIELDSSKFEFGCTAKKIPRTRLMVFESENCAKVRIYGINCSKKHYKCIKCNKAKAYVSLDDTTVKVLRHHSCRLVSYTKTKEKQEILSKIRIVPPEEFVYGMNRNREPKRRVIVFEPNNRELAREYYYKGTVLVCLKCQPKFVKAKIIKDQNGIEYVEVPNGGHRCKPRPYKEIKAEQDALKKDTEECQIFKDSDYKFLLNAKGAENGRLIIFSTKNKVYEYYRLSKFTYICLGCDRNRSPRNVRANAHVIKDKNGDECVRAQMSHVCQPVSYQKVMGEQKKIKEQYGLS